MFGRPDALYARLRALVGRSGQMNDLYVAYLSTQVTAGIYPDLMDLIKKFADANGILPDQVDNFIIGGSAPANTVAPSISGTVAPSSTVTAVVGTWTGTPTITYTYRWNLNGVDVGTASTYNIPAATSGQTLILYVTGTNSFGNAVASVNGVVA